MSKTFNRLLPGAARMGSKTGEQGRIFAAELNNDNKVGGNGMGVWGKIIQNTDRPPARTAQGYKQIDSAQVIFAQKAACEKG